MAAFQWLRETLYFDGDSYFSDMIRAIDSASATIELETYIFYPDAMGNWMADRLEAAARRGVRVRLLVDGIGALSWIHHWPQSLRDAGVEIRIWKPVRLWTLLSHVATSLLQRRYSAFLLHHNRRTHRKYCVIDEGRAFVGSHNIAANHLQRFSGAKAWRDTGIEVAGPELSVLLKAFNLAWDRSHTPEGRRRWFWQRRLPRLNLQSPVRLNFTHRLRRHFRRDLLTRIRGAKERVWITNAYLTPTTPLVTALLHAVRRGRDVRLLVPSTSDVFFMRWVATSFYGALLEGGVRIFEFQPSFLHAKSVVIDDWAMVGTSNLNRRSFLHDLEVDIVVSKSENRARMAEQFNIDLQSAREVTSIEWHGKRWTRFLGQLFSYILSRIL